jgi:hypothetical protein
MRRESHRLVSILLTLLLVTGTIAPVTALGSSEAGNTGGFGPDPVGETPPPRATPDTDQPAPRDRLHTAQYLLGDIDADGGQQQSAIRQVERRVNSSLDDYRDAYRVDSHQKFSRDAQATKRLTAFAGTSHATAANVTSAQLLWADRDTATLAIEEAERGIDRAEDRASEQELRKAERAIEQAESALDRADGHTENALDDAVPLDQRLRTRAKAIRAYGQAWQHARRALQILDRAVAPEITVRQQVRRPTPNATEYTRIVTGEIADPQAYELDSVRVQVGDRNPFDVPLNASTAPTTNATYSFPVTLSGPTEITVTARDPVETDRGTDRDRGSAGSSSSQTVGDSQSASADVGKQASNGNDKAGTGKQNRGKNGDKDQKNKGDDKRDKDKNKDKDKNDDPPGQSGD